MIHGKNDIGKEVVELKANFDTSVGGWWPHISLMWLKKKAGEKDDKKLFVMRKLLPLFFVGW